MSQQQRDHARRYMSSLARWKEKNLGDRQCHELAAAVARQEFPLSEEERREVDAWLDEKYPVRTNKDDRREPPSLFDDLPMAR